MESVHLAITEAREQWCLGPDVPRLPGKNYSERAVNDTGTFAVSAKLAAYWLAITINSVEMGEAAAEKASQLGIDGVSLNTQHGEHLAALQKYADSHDESEDFYYSAIRIRELNTEIGLLRPDIIQVLSVDGPTLTITTLFTLDGAPDVCTVVYRRDGQNLIPEAIWVDAYGHSLNEPLDIPAREFSLKAVPIKEIASLKEIITMSPLLLFQAERVVE